MKLEKLWVGLALFASLANFCAGSGSKSAAKQSTSRQSTGSQKSEAGGVEDGLVQVPKDIDHRPWEQLLKTYVNEQGLVNYGAWKSSATDMAALRQYLGKFSGGEPFASGKERTAALINGYNALTIGWILENYPTESIRELPDSFKGKRHLIGGKTVSLDDIEHETLRPLVGYRIHSALVCAARSCPPLRREAFRADILDKQLDESMTRWLARPDLNELDAGTRKARVSSIFKFFKEDFGTEGGTQAILAKYGPERDQAFLRAGKINLEYLPYNWGLNDQAGRGREYKQSLFKKVFKGR